MVRARVTVAASRAAVARDAVSLGEVVEVEAVILGAGMTAAAAVGLVATAATAEGMVATESEAETEDSRVAAVVALV